MYNDKFASTLKSEEKILWTGKINIFDSQIRVFFTTLIFSLSLLIVTFLISKIQFM